MVRSTLIWFLVIVYGPIAQAQPAPVQVGEATTESVPDTESVTPEPDMRPIAPPIASPVVTTTPPPFDLATINALVDEKLAARPRNAGWNNGFFIQNDDGSSRLKLGGYTQFDSRFFVQAPKDAQIDQFGFRSIRPDLQGTVFDHVDFRLLPDFAGGKLVVQDAYVDLHYTEVLKLRLGKFKVPFGLERLQSEIATMFVERALPSSIAPNRDLGAEVFGDLFRGLVQYQLGVFNGVADGGSGDGDVSNGKEVAARVWLKPFVSGPLWLRELGVGAAGTFGDKQGTFASPDLPVFKTEGQTTFFAYKTGTSLMDTVIASGHQKRGDLQADWFVGPVGVLAEYVRSDQGLELGGTRGNVSTTAWTAEVQWVLTGEAATYQNVRPLHAFDPSKGQWGAFDLVARINELKIDGEPFTDKFVDPAKSARRAWSAGAGLDWFTNQNFRMVLDAERTYFQLGAASGNRAPETTVVARAQMVF